MIKREFDLTIRVPQQDYIDTGIKLVQNDQDVYILNLRITDGITEIDYSQVSSATITFALANGSVVQSDPERLAISSGGITYEMGTTEISCPGKVTASIQLFGEDGERLTTARFRFEVVADLITPDAVQSESHFPLLQQLVADVEQLKQDIVDLQIPNNSIMDVKLSDAAGQIKQRFASHKADNVTDADGVHGLTIESGNWTPVVSGLTTSGANNYSVQVGRYTKIGNRVFFECHVALSNKDVAMAGNIVLQGLPYSIKSLTNYRISCTVYFAEVDLDATRPYVMGLMLTSTNYILLMKGGDNVTTINITPNEITNTSRFIVSGSYEI